MKKFPDYIQKLLGSSIEEDIIIGLTYIKDYPDLLDYFELHNPGVYAYGILDFSGLRRASFMAKTDKYVFISNNTNLAICWTPTMREAWLCLTENAVEL